ncbi:hypothetical protein [Saccharopolyspora griseoalba]|uniref:Uncharacterized protein n=1 Tax=Saccharopolyspora griseoalba TaxID=1431848 RepID=A0ABW2LQN9_9PSEU
MSTASAPPRQRGETCRAYYRRLTNLRDAVRRFLPVLKNDVVAWNQAQPDPLPIRHLAASMKVSPSWLHRAHPEADRGAELVPAQHASETPLEYYVRLRSLRDAIASALPQLLLDALNEAGSSIPRTQLAAELGLSEGQLHKKKREAAQTTSGTRTDSPQPADHRDASTRGSRRMPD